MVRRHAQTRAVSGPQTFHVTTPWSLTWRRAAERDAAALARYYVDRGGTSLEVAFLDELEAAFNLIVAYPESGSTRHADLFPELPAPLRFHPLRRFERILVYYVMAPDHVEIIRVWNATRGLEALLDDAHDESGGEIA